MKKIGIVGLGLIGGSIFKTLTKLGYDVCAVSNSMKGILPNITSDYNILKNCEMIFVCTAMNKTLAVLDTLENILSPETIVTDVCSLKTFVCNKERPYIFIPSHPMAGTEHKGFENSFDGLFQNAKWVLTPCFQVPKEARNSLEYIIKELGAETIITTPKEHDEAVALISHMPMLIAQAIFLTASQNQLALDIASSGFRDMTRLAMSNEEMACDMLNLNSENIKLSVKKLIKSINDLTSKNYAELIGQIKTKREKIFN